MNSSNIPMLLMLMLVAIVGIMIKSYFVQMSFNCAMPSVTGNKSMKITFQAALCLVVLCSLLFSSQAQYYVVDSPAEPERQQQVAGQQQVAQRQPF